jgi:hypothetical protein
MINKNLRPFLAAFFILFLVTTGCEKNREGLGSGLLDDGTIISGRRIDTLTLITRSIPDDSVRSDRLPNVMLGEYNDPIFGVTKAGFYTQVRLSSNNPGFTPPENFSLVLDSVVLAFEYSAGAHYGFKQPQNYAVYEMGDGLKADSIYFTNRTIPLASPENLVVAEFATQRPAPGTPTIVNGEEVLPQLRLRLNPALGQRLIDQSGTGNLTTDAFLNYFKGFYVTVENTGFAPGEGGIHYFNLFAANSKLTLYYRNVPADTTLDEVKLSYDFVINDNSIFFTKTNHNYSSASADLTAQFSSNPELGQQNLYVQSAAGVKVKIDFPFLNTLNSDTIAINKAILVVPYKPNNTFAPPQRMFLIVKNADGSSSLIPDQFEGDAHVDGFIRTDSHEYRINVSRWVQQVISGQRENYGIELFGQFAASSANRVELFGPENTERKMQLIIDYTKY